MDLFLLSSLLVTVAGHGFLFDPPARNAMWRFGYTNPVNYNDNELYCGGFSVQWQDNGGKCGVCGDNWAEPRPREHEAGGRYGKGIIGRRYIRGQTIDVDIDISANHWGYFELKICPVDGGKDPSQECFDSHPLVLADTGSDKFYVPLDSPKITRFKYQVVLPPALTCSQCVVQWTYFTGNTWGQCANGTEGMGCGDQEMFRNCADVQINSIVGAFPPGALSLYSQEDARPAGLVVTAHVCVATETYASVEGMDSWCQRSCLSYPPNCPEDKCQCLSHCEAVGRLAGEEGTDVFCHRRCLRFPPDCPKDLCKCYPGPVTPAHKPGSKLLESKARPWPFGFLPGYSEVKPVPIGFNYVF